MMNQDTHCSMSACADRVQSSLSQVTLWHCDCRENGILPCRQSLIAQLVPLSFTCIEWRQLEHKTESKHLLQDHLSIADPLMEGCGGEVVCR